MDTAESELSSVLEAVEAAFVDTLPPVYASVTMGDLRRRGRFWRLSYGDYVDGQWGIYVTYKSEGYVRIGEADVGDKIRAVENVRALYSTVVRRAEDQLRSVQGATAKAIEFLRIMNGEADEA